ncbi:hypothetical protein ABBQ38_014029 [Trebouxia sp. C0009 RCD-2024]
MLIFAGGATCLGAGDDDAAEADVAKYVAGGLLPLHYGSIKYLPCYAAAGARIKLGYFDQSGKVHWMLNPFDMRVPSQRARFIFAVINLARWFTLMTKQLPDRRFRVKLLEPWERANGVTITFQAGGRVCKQIRGFEEQQPWQQHRCYKKCLPGCSKLPSPSSCHCPS